MRNARAQHQRVHAMIQSENVAAHGLRAFAVGQIAADGVCVAALGAETIRQRFGVLKPMTAVEQHRIARARQCFGACAADAAGRAGDERNFFLHI